MESELEGVSDNIVGRASVQSIAVIEQRYFFHTMVNEHFFF